MEIKSTNIFGCFEIHVNRFTDLRGDFIKFYDKYFYEKNSLKTNFIEEYFNISNINVLRGMHFQYPPFDHEKIVYCSHGKVIDVVLDLRIDSSSYGHYHSTVLDLNSFKCIYIPKGVAHGFISLENASIINYKVTSEYNSIYDSGILWNSFSMNWPNSDLIISDRDKSFVNFNEFNSPFILNND